MVLRAAVVAAVVVTTTFFMGFSNKVSAITNAGNWTHILYLSDFSAENVIKESNVKIYWPGKVTGTKSVQLRLVECNPSGLNSNGSGTQLIDVNLFTKDSSGGLIETDYGITENNCYDADGVGSEYFWYSFNLTANDYDPSIGYTSVWTNLKTTGAFEAVPSSRAWFIVQAPNEPGVKLGYVGGMETGFSQDIGFNGDYSSMAYYDMTFRFGSSCGAYLNPSYKISLYDTEYGASWQQRNIRVWIDNGSDATNITRTSGFVSSRVGMGWWLVDPNKLAPNSGNKGESSFIVNTGSYAANDGTYRLHVDEVGEGNDIRIKFPGDEIYGWAPCILYTLSGTSQLQQYVGGVWVNVADGTNVNVGDQIRWVHRVVNDGPVSSATTDTQVREGSGDTSSVVAGIDPLPVQNTTAVSVGGLVRNVTLPSSGYTVVASDVGKRICRMIAYAPIGSNNPGEGASVQKCANVASPIANYELTPHASIGTDTVSQDDTPTFTFTVDNVGDAITNISWQARKIIIAPGVAVPAALSSMHLDWNCANYTALAGAGQITCANSPTATGTLASIGANASGFPVGSESSIVTQPLGTTICYVLMVSPYKTGVAQSRDSVADCVIVAKYPALTVKSGDVRVGGSFADLAQACKLPMVVTNTRNPYGILMHNYPTNRGSKGSYAATSPGLIYEYGTQGINFQGDGTLSARLLFGTGSFTIPAYSYGAGESGYFLGKPAVFTSLTSPLPVSYCLPEMDRLYPAVATPSVNANTTVPDLNAITSTNFSFPGNNHTLNLSAAGGSTLAPGKKLVIRVTQGSSNTGNVIRIKGPILYGSIVTTYGSINELPQLVVIADGDIDIRFDSTGSPMEVNGIFSTKGNVYTCGDLSGAVADAITTDNACLDSPLIVNGAIIASGRVLPYRTYGFNNSETDTYAETFNLNAETLLGDYSRAQSAKTLRVDYQNELPPRL